MHTESDTTSDLHTLGFENYYVRKDNTLFRYGHTNTYTQAKIVLKENTIVTFFPTNTRWMGSLIPIDYMEDPDLAMKLIFDNTAIPQDKWLNKNTLKVITHLTPDENMQYIANQWNTPVYAHPTPIIQPPEQMDLGVIDKWWVMSQEQSYMNTCPNIMLSAKNLMRVAAQRNLTRDPSKIPKSLKEFCLLAYNSIILYKPPYWDNQELVKKYMGRATICPTMELGWEEPNPTPLPPTVLAMPTSPAPTVPAMPTPSTPTVPAMPTPLTPTVPAMAQITPPPTLPVKMDMMTTHGLVPNLNMMTQMMTKTSVQTQSFLMTQTPNIQESISTMQAQAVVSTIPVAIAQAVDTAAESVMQQMNPQSPQEQYSSSNYETCTESQWLDTTIHQQHGVTLATTWLTGGKSSQVLASHLSQEAPMRPQDSLTQLATNYSTSVLQKSKKDSGGENDRPLSKATTTKVI